MKKNKLVLILFAIFVVSFLFIFQAIRNSQAQSGATGESDAIGVRIIPNPNHYSIYRWYESQGFRGSPQALVVDGYEAIRDGRTVYVNSANIDQVTKNIYTNIYLISYNQNSAAKTVDVLGQIVAHWKFNSNIIESTPLPNCAISATRCFTEKDCGKDQLCVMSSAASSNTPNGLCQLKTQRSCLVDSDCPANFFCNSVKAKVIRDIKRVGKLEELKETLFAFKKVNNRYPILSSGSYLANHTISVWPSWNEGLLAELAGAQKFIDPINRLGACLNYDSTTCWSKENKKFVYNPTPTYLMLPADSYAFVYKTDANGSNYNLCAVMESRPLGYQFSPNNPIGSDCVTATGIVSGGQATNTAPFLIDKSLIGEAGREFNGSLKVIDQEGNPLTWNFLTPGSWTGWKKENNLPGPPVLKDTVDPNQKKIYAKEAGPVGTYVANLIVSDGQGGILATSTNIKIINPAPFIEADDAEFVLDPKENFIYNFYFSDNNITNPNAAYSITKVSGPYDILSGLTKTVTSVGINKFKVSYSGLIPTSFKFTKDTNIVYKVTATDNFNTSATKNFTIRFLVENPSLSFNCLVNARLNQNYNCYIGPSIQGNHTLSYSSNPLPTGLTLSGVNGVMNTNGSFQAAKAEPATESIIKKIFNNFYNFLTKAGSAWGASTNLPPSGNTNPPIIQNHTYLQGIPTVISTGYKISLKAVNEYGASSTREFTLKINNYCGDGSKQAPNSEGRGGIYNDGYEDCDGNAGVTGSVSNSSPDLQYGCATGVGSSTPNPIPNNNYCVFKSPLAGGGYCGDGWCQTFLENVNNCVVDCVQNCTPDCAGKACGSDGCGGACGSCLPTEKCDSSFQCVPLSACGNGVCDSGEDCLTCSQDCACTLGQTCNYNGQCVGSTGCIPDCQGRTCGLDPVCQTLSCGTCVAPRQCTSNGACCQANCMGCVGNVSASSWEVCGGTACCNPQTETCCGGVCKPKSAFQHCGNTCCDLSDEICCGTQCRSNNWEPCGNTCCQPGKYCCANTHICVNYPNQCTGGQQ